ncbi:hypothetical protein F5B20DRAFT_582091 [Whalleya microplaca]|nr:hypothetical protein F5B20DRAFT_582091 [Whalleya microplaca]
MAEQNLNYSHSPFAVFSPPSLNTAQAAPRTMEQSATSLFGYGLGPSSSDQAQATLNVSMGSSELHTVKKVIIDANGDLLLQVGGDKCFLSSSGTKETYTDAMEFLVDSKALSRASRVFMKMLYGNFAESKKAHLSHDKSWRVMLPDDNVKAMTTLLHIMHCQFDEVPTPTDPISLENMYQIAVLTDKYDCTRLIRPWAKSWLAKTATHLPNATITILERISWVAWEYGDRLLFETTARRLVLSLTTSGGQLGTASPPIFFSSTLEPDGFKDLVLQHRTGAIAALLAPVESGLTSLLRPLPPQGFMSRTLKLGGV